MDAESIQIVFETEDGEKRSFVTDLVPAREYERVQAENAELRKERDALDRLTDVLNATNDGLIAENAKLRELVRGLWYCTENENKAMCEGCPLGIVDGDRLALACEKLMYELGVEV